MLQEQDHPCERDDCQILYNVLNSGAWNHTYTGDGDIDGTFFDRAGNRFLIQAKRYKSAINPRHVREFAEVIQREKAAGGFFIHTGRTGPKSYQVLLPTVRIISGNRLLALLDAKLS